MILTRLKVSCQPAQQTKFKIYFPALLSNEITVLAMLSPVLYFKGEQQARQQFLFIFWMNLI